MLTGWHPIIVIALTLAAASWHLRNKADPGPLQALYERTAETNEATASGDGQAANYIGGQDRRAVSTHLPPSPDATIATSINQAGPRVKLNQTDEGVLFSTGSGSGQPNEHKWS